MNVVRDRPRSTSSMALKRHGSIHGGDPPNALDSLRRGERPRTVTRGDVRRP
jgi:hypothetical protein